jgi:glycosyltransferase involved in cell wall biosynthesis
LFSGPSGKPNASLVRNRNQQIKSHNPISNAKSGTGEEPVKGHGDFLAALAILDTDSLTALLVGPGADADNRVLTGTIDALGLGKRVILMGERDDIPRIMAGLDLLCLASLSEGFPNVVGEAMACGVPCVVTDVGGAAVIVGDTGVVVPPGNSVALGEGIWRLLGRIEDRGDAMSLACRERICANYTLELVVKQYEDLYQM